MSAVRLFFACVFCIADVPLVPKAQEQAARLWAPPRIKSQFDAAVDIGALHQKLIASLPITPCIHKLYE